LGELRTPNTPRAKLIVIALAVLVFTSLSLGALGGFFLVRAMSPLQAGETIDPTQFLGNARTLEFTGPDGLSRSGWFFPGHRTAPVLVLCHGYKSSRSEILTLATSLQQHRYNVFVFNFAGHGESPVGYTTLGGREAGELQAAINMLAQRTDMDTTRIGLWGYSMGGYAVLQVASHSPRVQAIVVDSGYPSPAALLRIELRNLGAGTLPLLSELTIIEFRVVSLFLGAAPDVHRDLSRLTGVSKLFIVGDDAPRLGALTQELHNASPPPKELVVLPRTNQASLLEEDRRNYEKLVASFFQRALPLGGADR